MLREEVDRIGKIMAKAGFNIASVENVCCTA